ncbi:hypothetical protein ABK040_013151 [Willaertia magna]
MPVTTRRQKKKKLEAKQKLTTTTTINNDTKINNEEEKDDDLLLDEAIDEQKEEEEDYYKTTNTTSKSTKKKKNNSKSSLLSSEKKKSLKKRNKEEDNEREEEDENNNSIDLNTKFKALTQLRTKLRKKNDSLFVKNNFTVQPFEKEIPVNPYCKNNNSPTTVTTTIVNNSSSSTVNNNNSNLLLSDNNCSEDESNNYSSFGVSAQHVVEKFFENVIQSHLFQMEKEYEKFKNNLKKVKFPTKSEMKEQCEILFLEKSKIEMLFAKRFNNNLSNEDNLKNNLKNKFNKNSVFSELSFPEVISSNLNNNKFNERMNNENNKTFLLISDKESGSTKSIYDIALQNRSYLLYFDFSIDILEFEKKHTKFGNYFRNFGNVKCPNIILDTFYEDLLQKFSTIKDTLPFLSPNEHAKNYYIVRRMLIVFILISLLDLLTYLRMKQRLYNKDLDNNKNNNTIVDNDCILSSMASPRDFFLFRQFQNSSLIRLYTRLTSVMNQQFTTNQLSQFIKENLLFKLNEFPSNLKNNFKICLAFDHFHELTEKNKFLQIYKSRDGLHDNFCKIIEPITDAIQFFTKFPNILRIISGRLINNENENIILPLKENETKIIPEPNFTIFINEEEDNTENKKIDLQKLQNMLSYYLPTIIEEPIEFNISLWNNINNNKLNCKNVFNQFIGKILLKIYESFQKKKKFPKREEITTIISVIEEEFLESLSEKKKKISTKTTKKYATRSSVKKGNVESDRESEEESEGDDSSEDDGEFIPEKKKVKLTKKERDQSSKKNSNNKNKRVTRSSVRNSKEALRSLSDDEDEDREKEEFMLVDSEGEDIEITLEEEEEWQDDEEEDEE